MVAIVLAVFFVLNLQKVEVDLIVATVELPLVVALGIAAVLGLLLSFAFRRHRSDRYVGPIARAPRNGSDAAIGRVVGSSRGRERRPSGGDLASAGG